MIKIGKELFSKAPDRRDALIDRVNKLEERNSIIGQEATLKDVLLLFKEFNISRDDGYMANLIRTRIINKLLGGEV